MHLLNSLMTSMLRYLKIAVNRDALTQQWNDIYAWIMMIVVKVEMYLNNSQMAFTSQMTRPDLCAGQQ